MSGRSYYSSSKSKPVIEYPESSRDSRYYESGSSRSSRSSRDEYYSSNTSMSHGSDAASREQRYRDPYDDRKYVTSTTSKSGRVEVVDHRTSRYDADEPRLSDASSKHYKDAKKHRKDRR